MVGAGACSLATIPRLQHERRNGVGGVHREPCMTRFERVSLASGTMSGTGVRAERTDAIDDGEHAGEDLLEVLILQDARVEVQRLANDTPDGLEVLVGRHLKALILDVGLEHRFENVARRRHGLARVRFDVDEGSRELFVY
jgi:hypothetical protein